MVCHDDIDGYKFCFLKFLVGENITYALWEKASVLAFAPFIKTEGNDNAITLRVGPITMTKFPKNCSIAKGQEII